MELHLHIPLWSIFGMELERQESKSPILSNGQVEFHRWNHLRECGLHFEFHHGSMEVYMYTTVEFQGGILRVYLYIYMYTYSTSNFLPGCGQAVALCSPPALFMPTMRAHHATTRGPIALHTRHLHSRGHAKVQGQVLHGSDS